VRYFQSLEHSGVNVLDRADNYDNVQRRRERNRASQRAFRKRKEKYVQDLECHYLELRRRYVGLLTVLDKIRREGAGGDDGWRVVQDSERDSLVMANDEFEIC
jgi:hypothetical protein